MNSFIKNIYSVINRRLHVLLWKFGKNKEKYIKLQQATSHKTRENETVQKGILFALNTFYKYVNNKESFILDAGCGDGWTMDQLRSDGYSNIFGVDINDEKLESASREGKNNVKKALLPDLDFDDQYFDGIFCRHVYEHLLYPKETIQTFYRVLKNNGFLLIIAPESDFKPIQNESHVVRIKKVEDISNLVRKCGFKIVDKIIHIMDEKEFWVIARKLNPSR